MRFPALPISILYLAVFSQMSYSEEGILKAGIIGCDTSHVIAFTELINHPEATGSLAKVEVAYAYPGGSDDIPLSYERVPKFTFELKRSGVEILDSIAELVEKSDVILLESVDGRKHLDQFRQAAVGKPVFIDKPIAASLRDTLAIFQLANETGTPCFTASGLRYCNNVAELKVDPSLGKILGVSTTGPYQIEPHHPDLFWYGIHGVESLYALMGPGCEEVSRVDSDVSSMAIGKWHDGRIGTFRGIDKGHQGYTFAVFGSKDIQLRKGDSGYAPLVNSICDFLISGEPPVSQDETIEIITFMEAADESKRLGGKPVKLDMILNRVKQGQSAQ